MQTLLSRLHLSTRFWKIHRKFSIKMEGADNITKSHITTYKDDVDRFLNEHEEFIVLVKADEDENGKSWCPDCVKAMPNINEIILPATKKAKIPVLYVKAGTIPQWKDQKNDIRTHPSFQITSIPSLRWIQNKAVLKGLTEGELSEADLVNALFEEDE